MFYLRVVQNKNHFARVSFNRTLATKRVQNWDGTPPSVFAVEDDSTADRVAVLYAMMGEQPESVDYVLFPHDLFGPLGLNLPPRDCDIPHPLTEQTHREIVGLDTPEMIGRFVDELERIGVRGRRLSKGDVISKSKLEVADPAHGHHALALVGDRPKWAYLRDAASGSAGPVPEQSC